MLFASGFAEEGTPEGIARQDELKRFVAETGMLIGGPTRARPRQSQGTARFPTFLRIYAPPPPRGEFALIAQSGNMVATIMRSLKPAGIGYTYLINTGNEATIDFTLISTTRSTNPQDARHRRLCRGVARWPALSRRGPRGARDLGKPMFLVKAGRSGKGAEAVASHTAAMAGERRGL